MKERTTARPETIVTEHERSMEVEQQNGEPVQEGARFRAVGARWCERHDLSRGSAAGGR